MVCLDDVAKRIKRKVVTFRDGLVIEGAPTLHGDKPFEFLSLDELGMHPEEWSVLNDRMSDLIRNAEGIAFDTFAFLDSRGYLFIRLASDHRAKWIRIVKQVKDTGMISETYSTEYSQSTIHVQPNNLTKGSRVVIVDDLLATGGSVKAASNLIEAAGGTVVGALVAIELNLHNRLPDLPPVLSVFQVEDSKLVSRDFPLYDMVDHRSKNTCSESEVVMFYPDMKQMATEYVARVNSLEGSARLSMVDWSDFPDGYPDTHFESKIEDCDIVFFGSMHDVNSFDKQLSLLRVLPRQGIRSLKIHLPYFATATHERVKEEGELASAEIYARMISTLPMTKTGMPELTVVDLHTLQNRFYFDLDKVRVIMGSAIPLLLKHINSTKGPLPIIAFPDEGAKKRFGHWFRDFDLIICGKQRKGADRIITLLDGPPVEEGRRIIIVDDLVNSGGTLKNCAKAIRNIYGESTTVDVFVTHPVFTNDAHYGFVDKKDCGIDMFYTTDSIPDVAKRLKKFKDRFTVFGLVDVHRYFVNRVHHHYVGSTNPAKLSAISEVVGGSVVGIDVPSGISPQPMFRAEAEMGARNRLEHLKTEAQKLSPDNPWKCWSIESYCSVEDGVPHDRCVILSYDNQSAYNWECGDTISTPFGEGGLEALEESRASLWKSTIGSILEKKNRWAPHSWHRRVTGKSRAELIRDQILHN